MPQSSGTKDIPTTDALTTAVFVVDGNGLVSSANQAAENLAGASRSRLVGMPASALFASAPFWAGRLGDSDELPSITEVTEITVPGHVGPVKKVRVTASIPGELEGSMLLEVADYGLAMLAEKEEERAGLTEASRLVLRNLAHEIKNPLGGIRGAAQLLDTELASPDLREYTRVIIGEADRLQKLVDKLLLPYRARRKTGEVNIHEVLERVRMLLVAEFPRGLSFRRDYDVSAPAVTADREQLFQALLNIARNAAEALSDRIPAGDAEIRLVTRVAQQAQIGLRRCRMVLVVHVIDNGPGIPPGMKERIFYPLVTGKPNGSGLGLSIAQNFIQQQGGLVDVASRPGCTDFSIILPISP